MHQWIMVFYMDTRIWKAIEGDNEKVFDFSMSNTINILFEGSKTPKVDGKSFHCEGKGNIHNTYRDEISKGY